MLGWALVDLRSARRLALAALAGGVALVVALQVATSGGFLWVQGLWTLHPSVPGQGPALLAQFWGLAWPVLAVAMLAVLAAAGAQARVLREPAWLLLAGGGAVAPLLGKHGAGWNYLLPLFAAAVVAAACFLARAAQARRGGALSRAAPILALSVLAVSLAATRTFPLPTALDEATGRAFYGFTEELRRRAGGPVLATRPDFVYFLAGQPVEAEGSSFIHLAHAGAPGAEEVLQRLVSRRYSLVVWTWPLPSTPEWTAALHRGYERVGECRLGWYFGSPFPSYLAVRRDVGLAFAPPPGTRCTAVAPQG